MGRDVTGFASDPGCSPESVQPRTLGTCQLFALQLTGLPQFYLVLGWRLRVAVPWAAGEGAEFCPLDLATLAPAGPMPACPCEPRGSWSTVPAPPQQQSFVAGAGQQIAASQPSLLPPGMRRAHFRALHWDSPVPWRALGAHYVLSPVGHLCLQLHPVCGLVSASEGCAGGSGGALCPCR